MGLARQIYSADYDLTLEQNVEVAQRFTSSYTKLASEPKIQELKLAVTKYLSVLDKLGLGDNYFTHDYQSRLLFKNVLLMMFRVLFSIILAFPGYILHYPLHYLGYNLTCSPC